MRDILGLGCIRKYVVKSTLVDVVDEVHVVKFPNNNTTNKEYLEWSSAILVEVFRIDQLKLSEVQKQALVVVLYNHREPLSCGDGYVGYTSPIHHQI